MGDGAPNTAGPSLAAVEADLVPYLVDAARTRGVEIDHIARDEDLIERGVFDSLSLLDFVMHVERVVGQRIPSEDVVPENFGTLADISAYLGRTFGLS
jgi:acyl carrier protein